MSDLLSSPDTIYAPASGFGRAAVCVVRVSGPNVRDILARVAGGAPEPRRMSLRRLVDPQSGEALDEALVVWFPGPNSFTGEDQAELQIHGGLAVRQAVLAALSSIEGCRPAEPGEFTRRAFLAGRMDLTAVEGLADLVDAETEGQRRQALRQLEGGLGALAEVWRSELIRIQALLEAALDFADEGDVPDTLEEEAREGAIRLAGAIEGLLAEGGRGERLREGFHVVLAGPPNAGKSTLINALARRDVAIVSAVPGTTRDVIETRCDLDGLPVIFADTAGLRETAELVEREGVARARGRIDQADLVLWLDPADDPSPPPVDLGRQLHVVTKIDLAVGGAIADSDAAISAETGEGLPALLDAIANAAREALGAGDALVTRERHRVALDEARAAILRGVAVLETELFAEEIRLAARALGRISGRVDVEDVLDRLFSAFCIGK
ncbi:MAG: tRNA uridine-5-carboxymethylaminomethyl(34) synthesis GTPase MnmE [Microvirga sp.]|nr:tRNA uridine-5-carboxymethylaminomethyl(34) synthesis GTPase MnmE [Microvirga sp.]